MNEYSDVEQVLRKQPELQCCRVLKSLALLRLGREEEAESILDKVGTGTVPMYTGTPFVVPVWYPYNNPLPMD